MNDVYTIVYRHLGLRGYELVTGTDWQSAARTFRWGFPRAQVECVNDGIDVGIGRRVVIAGGVEERVLKVLREGSLLSCATIGEQLWGHPTGLPQHWCRPAARVLRRMERAGFVKQVCLGHRRLWTAKKVEVTYG